MFTPETSGHFVPYIDPVSHVTSYILNTHVAPLQQSFYFTNISMTDDGRYLWFYCGFPPAGDASFGRSMGVVDFKEDTVTHFPEMMFLDASPMVDKETGELFFCNYDGIYARMPQPDAKLRRIWKMPDTMKTGVCQRIATHLTYSADHTKFGVDIACGDNWFGGTVDIATGEYEEWYRRDYSFNHLQMNPADNDLLLIAEDYWSSKSTGEPHIIRTNAQGVYQRLWTLRRGETPVLWPPKDGQKATHEWWSRDGKYLYYVRHGEISDVCRIDMASGDQESVVPTRAWHCHSNADDTLFILDENQEFWRGCESDVRFYNARTKKFVTVVTKNPSLFTRAEPCKYHIDPHPQFTAHDRYVAFTTTVMGRIDIALTPVAQLTEMSE